jgi:hypothetical protein
MRRLLLPLSVGVLLASCERFAARSDVAANVGDHQLPAERVATIMGKSGGGPTIQAAEFISNLWLDYSLFARAVAEQSVPTDTAAIESVLWPTMSTIRVNLWRDSVRARQNKSAPAEVDSAYNGNSGRIVQHIIVVPAGPTAADSAAARRQLADALVKIKSGTKFGQLAAQLSSDGSKNDEGFLPYGPRGQFVKEFDDVAWSLAPGQVSDIVVSSFGYHLIRRPLLEEARARIERGLAQRGNLVSDSTYIAELERAANLKVASGAPAAMKNAVAYPETSRKSGRSLVSLKGGDFTLADFVKWTAMFPLQSKMQIRNAPDSSLMTFARELGIRTLQLRAADSAGVKIEPQMKTFAILRYNQAVTQLQTELGLTVPELSDSSKLSSEQKIKLASDKVEDFFGRLIEGRAQMVALPPELADHFRAGGSGKVNQAGIARAVELARAQFVRDSASAAGRAPPGAIQQAPGGPPIGGADSGKAK